MASTRAQPRAAQSKVLSTRDAGASASHNQQHCRAIGAVPTLPERAGWAFLRPRGSAGVRECGCAAAVRSVPHHGGHEPADVVAAVAAAEVTRAGLLVATRKGIRARNTSRVKLVVSQFGRQAVAGCVEVLCFHHPVERAHDLSLARICAEKKGRGVEGGLLNTGRLAGGKPHIFAQRRGRANRARHRAQQEYSVPSLREHTTAPQCNNGLGSQHGWGVRYLPSSPGNRGWLHGQGRSRVQSWSLGAPAAV